MKKLFSVVFLVLFLTVALAPTACAQVTSPHVSVMSKAIQPQPSEQPLGRVMLRYNVGYKDGKFMIPPTGKELTLGERLGVIFLVAQNYKIPYQVLGALCFQEGWDKKTGERCKNWYNDGTIVTSVSGAICGLQIYLPSHPEADKGRLLSDFTYCAEMGAQVLIASGGGPKSPTDPRTWSDNIRGYYGWGKPETESYLAAVLGFVTNPPVVEGKKPW